MKTAISISDSLFQRADEFAKRLGVSRSQLYATALTEYLERREAAQVTARLDTVYGITDGRVAAPLASAQPRSAAREDRW
jgi:metal-responsive CopG/Arc/MetJ family transcriptional regulator